MKKVIVLVMMLGMVGCGGMLRPISSGSSGTGNSNSILDAFPALATVEPVVTLVPTVEMILVPTPHQQPVIPTSVPSVRVHVVQPGDTLANIARYYGVSVEQIVRDNGIANPNVIYPGQEFVIRLGPVYEDRSMYEPGA